MQLFLWCFTEKVMFQETSIETRDVHWERETKRTVLQGGGGRQGVNRRKQRISNILEDRPKLTRETRTSIRGWTNRRQIQVWTFNHLKAAACAFLPHGLVRKLWNLENSIANNFRGMLIPTASPCCQKSPSLSPPQPFCSLRGIKQEFSLPLCEPLLWRISSASVWNGPYSSEWQNILNSVSLRQSDSITRNTCDLHSQ